MIDRFMQGMDTYVFAKQSFHGTLVSAEYGVRASCLLSHGRPSTYNPPGGIKRTDIRTPLTRLNGFAYDECWLQNMLIATSGQAMYRFQQKKLG